MTTAERAQAAADFLNAGERWRYELVSPFVLKHSDPLWERVWVGDMFAPQRKLKSEFFDRREIIALAKRCGWQENETPNVPQTGAETGQGEGG